MKKMKNDNKGFTLVELIVVLVILAILAAILVPALLGYIDEARNKQLQLHGKSVYTAGQAVASQMYGTSTDPQKDNTNKKKFADKVWALSEMADYTSDSSKVLARIQFSKATGNGKDSYKIIAVEYTEDSTNWIYYSTTTNEWSDLYTTNKVTSNYIEIKKP